MPDSKPLAAPSNDIYVYDGGLAGFYCCVHESVYSRRIPAEIISREEWQPSFLEEISIHTDMEKSKRVRDSVSDKISPRALELIETVFLSCMEKKELYMLRFLLLAYQTGPKLMSNLVHPDVAPLLEAERHLLGERHLLLGFIRFSDYDGVLAATISPKNFVLPYIAPHFISRYSGEDFMIYDKSHKAALIYERREAKIIPLDHVEFPAASEKERRYQAMWKQFYKTIAIEARYNPKCRMTHMPKRYWENMLEVEEELRLPQTKGKHR